MKLTITYTKEKDIDNFLSGIEAINRTILTTVEEEFNKRFNELNKDNLSIFIDEYTQEEEYDISAKIEAFTQQWSAVEDIFIKRCEALFSATYPIETVVAYITINNRCTY